MPTARSDRRPLTGAVLAALLVVAACSSDAEPPSPEPRAEPTRERSADPRQVGAPDVVRGITRTLDRRADAVAGRDRDAFLAGVAPAAREAQATYFDNLAQLPVGTIGYDLDRTTLVRQGDDYWAEVEVTLQLEGYDALPVVTRDRYLFAAGRRDTFRLASTTDEAWEDKHDVVAQPWESGPVTVVEGSHALGVFDAGSAGVARAVVRDVEDGIAAVAAEVPYEWSRRVVVYAFSEPDFLAGLDGLPGDDPLALDAVTFPVLAAPGSPEVAATRFVLNPRMVAAGGPARHRLIRHELTHVALGTHQGQAPTWLSEGLAEYVSVRPIAPEDRAISGAALDAAEREPEAMPADDTFNGSASQANYGLAWWACEYLADTYDESMLWALLDAMSAPDEAPVVLEELFGITEKRLARRSAKLMLDTYRPEKPDKDDDGKGDDKGDDKGDEDPSDGPSGEPGDGPSDQPTDEPSGG